MRVFHIATLLLLKLSSVVIAASTKNGEIRQSNSGESRTDPGQEWHRSEIGLSQGSVFPSHGVLQLELATGDGSPAEIHAGWNKISAKQRNVNHDILSQKSPILYAHRQKRDLEPPNHEEDMEMQPSEQRSAYIQNQPQHYPAKIYAPQPYQPPHYPTYPAYQPPKEIYQQAPPNNVYLQQQPTKYTQYQPQPTYLAPAPSKYNIPQKPYQNNQPNYPPIPSGYGPAPQPMQPHQPAPIYPQKGGQYPSPPPPKPASYPASTSGPYSAAYEQNGGKNNRYDLMPYSARTVSSKCHHKKKYYYDDYEYDDDKYVKLTYKQLKKLLKLDSYPDNYGKLDYDYGSGYKSADDEDMSSSEEAFREARHKKKHRKKHHHHKKFRFLDDSEEDEDPNMGRTYHLPKCHHYDDDYYDHKHKKGHHDKYDDEEYGYMYRALANLEDADEASHGRNNSTPRVNGFLNAGHEALNFAQKAGSGFVSSFDEDRKSLMGAAKFLTEGFSQGVRPFLPKAREADKVPRNAYAGALQKPYLGLLKDPYGYDDDDDYDDYATIVHHKHKGHKKGHSKPPAHDHHALMDMYGKCPVCDIHEAYEKGKYMSEQALKKLNPSYSTNDIESTLYDLTHSDSSKAPSYSPSYGSPDASGTKKKVLGPSGNPAYANPSYSNQQASQDYASGYGTPPTGYGASQQGLKPGSAPGASYGLYGSPAYGIKKTYNTAHDPIYSIVTPVQAPGVSYTSVY